MSQDRNEKYAGQDESEYHFSDEDISYEVETDAAKPAAVTEPKENLLSRLNRSKRMLISLVVFLALVFVVYKMVAPNAPTNVTATDIVPAAQQAPANRRPVTQPMQQNQVAVQTPAMPTQQTPVMSQQPAMQQPAQASAMQTAPVMQQPVAVNPPQQQMANTNTPMPQGMSNPPQMTQPAMQMPQTMQPPVAQQAPNAMPPVISVQPPAQAYNANQAMMPPQQMPTAGPPPLAESGPQAEYAQKLNEFANQNKALQDQMQVLRAQVASMEAQMNQLVRALLRQNQSSANGVAPTAAAPQVGPEPKIAYSVQAIIPGRAWLRSDNGETVTVAEGDAIKDLGRVTKIDPYDGVVEVNTGSKVVSLSYGAGG